MHTATIKFTIRDGKLAPATHHDHAKYKAYEQSLKENSSVEMFLTYVEKDDDKTLGQLAKIHAMIRELADKSGHGFNEIKDVVKENAGLTIYDSSSVKVKSFSECNKEELSRAIQACIEIGNTIGCQLD